MRPPPRTAEVAADRSHATMEPVRTHYFLRLLRRRFGSRLFGVAMFAAAAGLLPTVACSPLRVAIDADSQAPFATYRQYAWLGVPPPPTGNPIVDDNALLENRIRTAVDRELAQRGYTQVAAEQAQFTVHYHAILDKRSAIVTRQDYEVYGNAHVLRTDRAEPIEYTEGTLILDIHDAGTERLVWRGVAREAVDYLLENPDEATRAIDRAVERLLREFPPD